MKNHKDIFVNRFKPAVYDQKNLINFKRPLVWMTGIEKHGNYQPNGFLVFLTFCALGLAYYAYQTFLR